MMVYIGQEHTGIAGGVPLILQGDYLYIISSINAYFPSIMAYFHCANITSNIQNELHFSGSHRRGFQLLYEILDKHLPVYIWLANGRVPS